MASGSNLLGAEEGATRKERTARREEIGGSGSGNRERKSDAAEAGIQNIRREAEAEAEEKRRGELELGGLGGFGKEVSLLCSKLTERN